jgi:hypothetical protein
MHLFHWQRALIVTALAAMLAPLLHASTVLQLNLAELVNRADRIYRGKVLSVTEGVIDVAGGRLPVVTYRVAVDDLLRGNVAVVKGLRIAELRMLGKPRPIRRGNLQFVSSLPDLPELTVGEEYLLFATRPSAIGLSTTVGLGQGFFSIRRENSQVVAVNGANNHGLFRGMAAPPAAAATPQAPAAAVTGTGPVAYDELARMIRGLLAARGGRP